MRLLGKRKEKTMNQEVEKAITVLKRRCLGGSSCTFSLNALKKVEQTLLEHEDFKSRLYSRLLVELEEWRGTDTYNEGVRRGIQRTMELWGEADIRVIPCHCGRWTFQEYLQAINMIGIKK